MTHLLFRLEGELDIARLDELERRGSRALSLDGMNVVADMSTVTFIDSSGLGWLLRLQEELHTRGGSLRVVHDGVGVFRRLLGLTGLEDVFEVFDSAAEAYRATTAAATIG